MSRPLAAACVLAGLLIAPSANADQETQGSRTSGAPLKGVDVKLGKRIDARCADPQPCPTPTPSATPPPQASPKPSGG